MAIYVNTHRRAAVAALCLSVRGLAAMLLLTAALVGPIAYVASTANAVVPGANGLLVFSRQICLTVEDPCWEIVVANSTDTEETVVAGPYPQGVFDEHFVANWAPDGRSVIFMADLGDGQAIWQVNADGSGFHQVFVAPPDGTGLDDGPAFTPDGAWIIFTRCCPRSSGYGLWRVRPDGTGLRIVTTEHGSPKVEGPSDTLPQVSPNGRTITFNRNANGGARIATVNFAGGRLREITPFGFDAQFPNWSPDSQRIVFVSFGVVSGGDVWEVNADGSRLTQLTFDGHSLYPSYSPDGTKIIFGHRNDDGQRDLYTMNPDGTGISQLTNTAAIERSPQWAPAR